MERPGLWSLHRPTEFLNVDKNAWNSDSTLPISAPKGNFMMSQWSSWDFWLTWASWKAPFLPAPAFSCQLKAPLQAECGKHSGWSWTPFQFLDAHLVEPILCFCFSAKTLMTKANTAWRVWSPKSHIGHQSSRLMEKTQLELSWKKKSVVGQSKAHLACRRCWILSRK